MTRGGQRATIAAPTPKTGRPRPVRQHRTGVWAHDRWSCHAP
ncbi:hypothetical protein YT1_4456 [Rhodococcus ruber]|nr:hypothetical protein YT1_4456 [Rhodococcus ruber]